MAKKLNKVTTVGVIINPVSGQPQPILQPINNVFHRHDINWDIYITKKDHDAKKFTKKLLRQQVDLIVVYGGDGTVMEVASSLINKSTPMAILPGGTANVVSVELNIPAKLDKAAQLAINPKSHIAQIDIGKVGNKHFLHRVGLGLAADKVKRANRSMKNKYGKMAYSIAALQSVKSRKMVSFNLTIDGKKHQTTGVSCHIANSGNMGAPGIKVSPSVNIDDGLLDVLVLRDLSTKSLHQVLKSMRKNIPNSDKFHHWQGKEISIKTNEPINVQGDGEVWGYTPIKAKIIPHAVNIVIPPK